MHYFNVTYYGRMFESIKCWIVKDWLSMVHPYATILCGQ